ncbi:MAG TPA: cation-translocating P-type ATPase, partial [Saprospiraceae bacterium]|nr:cation-translocating P-type ATPase [Saprospiraceae bacterium]
WASEPEPFDAMEKALLQELGGADPRSGFGIVKEYALSGRPPMMTHIWENAAGQRIIACKGAVERVLDVADAPPALRERVMTHTDALAERGYRVLGVASAVFEGADLPADQGDFPWTLEGLVAFYDPPKENVGEVFRKFYQAGVRVMMITGDHASTAKNIARHTGLRGWEHALTGHQVMGMEEAELREAVKRVNVFARMFPDAKLRVVEALKADGETVAMSGDGVNDGPALKAAQIGVAMGKKGTEIAKSAASLVLVDDNLGAMVQAIRMGRRIYDNLRKAIRYIISIHLPIVLVVLLPLLLGWPYTHILLPLHVIFLELVMDPTAAIAFENEPAEPNLMRRPPRRGDASLFSWKELGLSMLQGVMITVAVLGMYLLAVQLGKSEAGVRSVVFATLVASNLFLTLSNRSFEYALHHTLFFRNRMLPVILTVSAAMLIAILYLPFLTQLFRMEPLSAMELALCVWAGFCGVAWFEAYKAGRELWRGSADAEHDGA